MTFSFVPSEWVGGDFNRRASLAEQFNGILPGTVDQREAFIDIVIEELDVHFKLARPIADSRLLWPHRLRVLEVKARAFAQAACSLDESTLWRLMMEFLAIDRENNPSCDPSQAIATAETKAMELRSAASVARSAAEAISRTMKSRELRELEKPRVLPNRWRGVPIDAAIRTLVKQVASGYARIYGERPSAAREGTFYRVLKAILLSAEANIELGEKRLKVLLQDIPLLGSVPAPRRGPKRRRN